MDLQPRTIVNETLTDKEWLGSDHGLDCPFAITLDITNGGFTLATDSYGSQILDGTGLIYDAASKMYRAVPNATTPAVGHLLESVRVPTGATAVGGSLFWHGVVIMAKVPTIVGGGAFVTANQVAKNILYR